MICFDCLNSTSGNCGKHMKSEEQLVAFTYTTQTKEEINI